MIIESGSQVVAEEAYLTVQRIRRSRRQTIYDVLCLDGRDGRSKLKPSF